MIIRCVNCGTPLNPDDLFGEELIDDYVQTCMDCRDHKRKFEDDDGNPIELNFLRKN